MVAFSYLINNISIQINLFAAEQRGIDLTYRTGRLKTAFGGLN
jgi:hypothetical protein